jgi:sugar (pentulose or hexulose) kinase
MKQKAILIFDIGKTNKKYFLFNERYEELQHEYIQFSEIQDDDGFPCDNLPAITGWIADTFARLKSDPRYNVTHINFSAYGATLVNLDRNGVPCTPVYNYQKEFPVNKKIRFEEKYGPLDEWSKTTASPWLGMLNAGLQLFWLKYEKPFLFQQIYKSLFLPQYLSYILTGSPSLEFTSLGCHTGLWDFRKNEFHPWVNKEGIDLLFPPVVSTYSRHHLRGGPEVGVGIHDSSSALVAYKRNMKEPFMLLSTGTWSICLNPFNYDPLTTEELQADCLCYLQPEGLQVKASRFFLGNIFSGWEKRIADFFHKSPDYHHNIAFSDLLFGQVSGRNANVFIDPGTAPLYSDQRPAADLNGFDSYEAAYYQLLAELVDVQAEKVKLVSGGIRRIHVDGGFVSNPVFLRLLEKKLEGFIIHASDMALGTSLGAAIVVSQGYISGHSHQKTKIPI